MDLIRKEDGIPEEKRTEPAAKQSGKDHLIKGRSYQRAGRYRLYREMISYEYTRGYALFRKLFLATGSNLEKRGSISLAGDVFYLTLEEHDRLMGDADSSYINQIREEISKRKKEMNEFEDLTLPSIIYGEVPPPLVLGDEKVLHGIATSPGHFQGEIVVVKSREDFRKKVENSILVIPYADVSWTPLLVKAGAIVSESGGMLSHAAIVARELSIPSVSSVDHACQLNEGLQARVDGYHGVLQLNDQGGRE
jgi:pyruvate,water dikinase